MRNKIISNFFSFYRRLTEIILLQREWKLAWNYFRIISEAYCSSRIFSNMFNVADI